MRKVEAMPCRPLSRNSTIVACVPTATISVGAGFVRDEQRGVFAHAFGDELVVLDTGREQILTTGRASVGMHVVDELRAAVHRVVGQRVEVADDQSGRSFMSSSASAPPSTAISTGLYSRTYGRSALRSCS